MRSTIAPAAMPSAGLLPVSRKANVPYRIVRLVAVPLLHFFFRFDVAGLDKVPRIGTYLVIANHLNWLDEFALLMLLPIEPRLHFLANGQSLAAAAAQPGRKWFHKKLTNLF